MGPKPKQIKEKRTRRAAQKSTPAGRKSSPPQESLISLSREPILVVRQSDLRIIDANAATCELYEYTFAELKDLTILELSPDRERNVAQNRLQRSSRGRKEFQHLSRSGNSIFVEFDNVPTTYGGVQAYLCLIHDITTRSQLVRALLESDATNREIIENASDMIYTHDLEGNFTSGNRAVTKFLGYTREDYLGMNIRKMVHPDDQGIAVNSIREKLSGAAPPRPYSLRVFDKAGNIRTIEVNTRLVYRDGKPFAVQGIARDVTERDRIQAALRESESKFRAVAESAPCAIVIYQENHLVFANPMAEKVSGYSAKELVSFPELWGLAAPEDQAGVRERAERRLRGETVPDNYEFRIQTKSGDIRWMSSTASRIIYGGKPAIVAMLFDISERKRFEQELRTSEERYRQLFERNLAGVFRCTMDGRFVDCNDAFATILGFKNRDQVLRQSAWSFSANEASRESFISRLQQQRVLTNIEEPVRRADGEIIWVLENVALLSGDVEGETVIEGTVIDITERKRADAELRSSEEKYRRLFERNLAGVYVSTLDGKLLDCNESLAHIYGYLSRDEVLALNARDLYMSDSDRHTFIRGLRQRRVYTNLESRCRRKDGSAFWVLENVALIPGINGEPDRIQGTMIDITERKLAEQALVESEAKFRAVADTAASAIYIHDGKNFLYSNQASEVISGYSGEELKQMRAFDLVHPDDRQITIERGLARQQGKPVPSRYEYRIIAKDGAVKWLDFSASPVRFEGRDAILATAFDITERKRVERIQAALYQIAERANAAEELEFFFRGIHGIISDLMYARNLYIALYQSDEQLITYPYYVDEKDEPPVGSFPLGKGLTEYVLRHGQAVLVTPEHSSELAAAGEIELVGSDCVDWLGAPLRSGNRVFGVIAVQSYTDAVRYNDHDREVLNFVSQHLANAIVRKRNEEALRESEQRYRSLVQSAVYGIYRSGLDDRFLNVNPAMVRLLGYDTEQEVLNLSLKNDVYVDTEEREDLVSRHKDGEGRIENVEVRWKRKDQRVITVRLSGRAVRRPNGEFDSFEMIAEDVTERRNLEDQLRQSQKMEAVGRLAGGVAHDFNNLLTVIKGYTELMLEEFREHDPMRGELEEIRKAADRASALTRQLLAFSRQQVLAPKVLDLNTVVTNMDKLLKRLLGADVELITRLDAAIGRIKADPGQLEQVIMNLAVNARDAMPVGGKLLIETQNVELDETFARDHVGSKPGAYVMLAVTDNGAGMSETVRQRIFEPFFTTKEAGKGTGLGLSTVYGIIKQSGGYIWVYSEVSKGTTFKVYLPRVDATVDVALPAATAPASSFGRETVLLVEDEDGVRALVRQVLHKHGYNVLEARHGGEALLHCERHKGNIDLLLTDVVLEQMSGPDLAKRLVVLRPEMKVLYISGYTDDAVIHHGVSTGTAFLQKPFTTDALAKKVREVLDRVPQV